MLKKIRIQPVWILKNVVNTTIYPVAVLVLFRLLYIFWPFVGYIYVIYLLIFLFIIIPVIFIPIYSTIKNWNQFSVIIAEDSINIKFGTNESIFKYGNLRNVFFIQDWLDTRLKLGSITIEIMSDTVVDNDFINGKISLSRRTFGKKNYEFVGRMGNLIHIPGLSIIEASEIKKQIEEKMKESQLHKPEIVH